VQHCLVGSEMCIRDRNSTSIVDINTNVLRQYFMFSFTYNLRKFKGQNGQGDFRREGMPKDMKRMFRGTGGGGF
jgi:hypothetical protein